jgi:hypothetical protein
VASRCSIGSVSTALWHTRDEPVTEKGIYMGIIPFIDGPEVPGPYKRSFIHRGQILRLPTAPSLHRTVCANEYFADATIISGVSGPCYRRCACNTLTVRCHPALEVMQRVQSPLRHSAAVYRTQLRA